MPKYVGLINWTEQGVKDYAETTRRAEHARQAIEQLGGRLESLYWTLGRYDLVGIIEAPDDETAAAMMLRISSGGAIRSETLRAFTAEEMGGVLQKLA